MTITQMQELLELISNLVSSEGTWTEKRDALLAEASEDDKISLEEFLGWFEE